MGKSATSEMLSDECVFIVHFRGFMRIKHKAVIKNSENTKCNRSVYTCTHVEALVCMGRHSDGLSIIPDKTNTPTLQYDCVQQHRGPLIYRHVKFGPFQLYNDTGLIGKKNTPKQS